MSNFSDEFISLICPHCGGKVEIKQAEVESSFFVEGDTFVYIGNSVSERIACGHCKTEFIRKQKYAPYQEGGGGGAFDQRGQTVKGDQVNINTGGGAFIRKGVRMNGGDFIARDSITVVIGNGGKNIAVGKNINQFGNDD